MTQDQWEHMTASLDALKVLVCKLTVSQVAHAVAAEGITASEAMDILLGAGERDIGRMYPDAPEPHRSRAIAITRTKYAELLDTVGVALRRREVRGE